MTVNAFRFQDKIALITGGSSGIGLATAQRLLDEGAHVVITGRDKTRLDAAAAALGSRALAVAADVTDPADLDALTRVVRERHGRLDVVFVNAGIGAFQPISTVAGDEFDRVVDINFKAAFFTVQHTVPLLAGGGAIVLNASFVVHRGAPATALYSATKAAVHNLTRTLAVELAPKAIRVNSVSPGFIDTPAFRAEVAPDAQTAAAELVAAGRLGRGEDVAAAVAFLASADAAYLTGQDLRVDGGLTTIAATAMV
ncbi:glucose 1-dehydrogenase [Nocardia yunnanensis]|uniref:Glucose 1-dehydrogenase n=1 Tax=Nocardia yunnanensis TaxID=2382165 RepID=A0A386ZBX6_9NOCA|nr:glucose 1-dehydrogenase [Nocardia yunnanensis]AYF75362.1 glucose 1-dehydrogenase [Nocardia yunnanensis]